MYLALRAQGERVPGLLYWMAQRVRTAHEIAQALERGEPVGADQARAADALAGRRPADRRRPPCRSRAAARRAIEELADLELASRGGGAGAASEDTAALRAIQEIAE